MGLETGTYVADLVITNPVASDNPVQGDDHLRLIKSALKNSLPKDLREVASPLSGEKLVYGISGFKNESTRPVLFARGTSVGTIPPSTSILLFEQGQLANTTDITLNTSFNFTSSKRYSLAINHSRYDVGTRGVINAIRWTQSGSTTVCGVNLLLNATISYATQTLLETTFFIPDLLVFLKMYNSAITTLQNGSLQFQFPSSGVFDAHCNVFFRPTAGS